MKTVFAVLAAFCAASAAASYWVVETGPDLCRAEYRVESREQDRAVLRLVTRDYSHGGNTVEKRRALGRTGIDLYKPILEIRFYEPSFSRDPFGVDWIRVGPGDPRPVEPAERVIGANSTYDLEYWAGGWDMLKWFGFDDQDVLLQWQAPRDPAASGIATPEVRVVLHWPFAESVDGSGDALYDYETWLEFPLWRPQNAVRKLRRCAAAMCRAKGGCATDDPDTEWPLSG